MQRYDFFPNHQNFSRNFFRKTALFLVCLQERLYYTLLYITRAYISTCFLRLKSEGLLDNRQRCSEATLYFSGRYRRDASPLIKIGCIIISPEGTTEHSATPSWVGDSTSPLARVLASLRWQASGARAIKAAHDCYLMSYQTDWLSLLSVRSVWLFQNSASKLSYARAYQGFFFKKGDRVTKRRCAGRLHPF